MKRKGKWCLIFYQKNLNSDWEGEKKISITARNIETAWEKANKLWRKEKGSGKFMGIINSDPRLVYIRRL